MNKRQPILLFVIAVIALAIQACGGGSDEEATPTVDLDFSRSPATAAGCVWYDDNGNGVFDDDEEPVVGQPVEVRDPQNLGGEALGNGTTNDDGCYEIPFTYEVNPNADDEFVVIVQPLTCCEFTIRPGGGAGLITSGVDGNGRGDDGDLYVDAGVVRPEEAAGLPAGGGETTDAEGDSTGSDEDGATSEESDAGNDGEDTSDDDNASGDIDDTVMITNTTTISDTSAGIIWNYTFDCQTGTPIAELDLDLPAPIVGGVDVVYNPNSDEMEITVLTAEDIFEQSYNLILNLDWGGGPLLNFEPSADNPLGGGGVSDAIFIENGIVTGAIRAVNTASGPVFTNSTAVGTVEGNTATLTLPAKEAPGGATLIGGGATDGSYCYLPFPLNEMGIGLEEFNVIGEGVREAIADNPQIFCNPSAGVCTSSSGDLNANPDGTFTITVNPTASGFFGRGPLTPDERVAEFSSAGWSVSEAEVYGTPFQEWFVYVLSASGVDQGYFAVSQGVGSSNEVQLFVAAGEDLSLFRAPLLEMLDYFRGPFAP